MQTSSQQKPSRRGRSAASFAAQASTESAITPLLEANGYQVKAQKKRAGALEIEAIAADSARLNIRLRTCWTWIGAPEKERRISGAQLLVLKGRTPEAAFVAQSDAWGKAGVTHVLVVQSSDDGIALAALIALGDLRLVWQRQREVCSREIQAGRMGSIRSNFVENGDSPTLWLMDEREAGGRAVVDALWSDPRVTRLQAESDGATEQMGDQFDTYDDLRQADYSAIGTDGADRVTVVRSNVRRDDRVRRAVIERAVDGCEREGCDDGRTYKGFLDVHHILGVGTSDRVWNCVALCPSCHRAAHFAPEQEAVNRELYEFALRFAPPGWSEGRRVAQPRQA